MNGKKIIKFLHKHRYDLCFVLLLAYSLAVRISGLNPHYFASDLQRDYLIGNHIITFNEAPKFGPGNSVFGSAVLPIYNYMTAFFLLIKNDAMFLNFVNILLQVA